MPRIRIQCPWLLLLLVLIYIGGLSAEDLAQDKTLTDDDDVDKDEGDLLDLDIIEEVLSQQSSEQLGDLATQPIPANESISEDIIVPVSDESVQIKSNLDTMTDDELVAICQEHGVDIPVVGKLGSNPTHEDLVNAAKKCLSLEDEVNAILAEDPDLSADLESEIERMKVEKERLEKEREAILAEKAELEEKLRRSGITIPADVGVATKPVLSDANATDAVVQSVDQVLRESFVLLFDRVGKDMRLVGQTLRVVLKPLGSGIEFIWKYTAPTIEGLALKSILVVDGMLGAERVASGLRQANLHWQTAVQTMMPLFRTMNKIYYSVLEPLGHREDIRQVGRIVESFFGPLYESLLGGWTSIQPDLIVAKQKTLAWFNRLKEEHVRYATSRHQRS